MMMQLESYLDRGRDRLEKIANDPRIRTAAEGISYIGAGFSLGAASLANAYQPFAAAFVCSLSSWHAIAATVGGVLGYLLLWGKTGMQGAIWTVIACMVALSIGKRAIVRNSPLLIPSIAALIVSLSGLMFQIFRQDDTSVSVYLLRVALACVATGVFLRARGRDRPIEYRLAQAFGVMGLAQLVPVPHFSLGIFAGSIIAVRQSLPAAVLAALALDLSQVTKTPMAAVFALAYAARFLPMRYRKMRCFAPMAAYLVVMSVCMTVDAAPLIPLLLGGIVGTFLPQKDAPTYRHGAVGIAQVRLEKMAGVLGQMHSLLPEEISLPVDETALLARTRERACGGCPHRKLCPEHTFPEDMLHRPLDNVAALPFPCRKSGRMIAELRRSREQLRQLSAQREMRSEYRAAVLEQYRFLGDYLRNTADLLAQREKSGRIRYHPETAVCTVGKHSANGDRCACFSGTENRYYIALCDGMGTGEEAAYEGKNALCLLREMLQSGLPAQYALRCFNNLLVLRGCAGASTVDLAEIDLTTAQVSLYKWGAAPSWILRENGAEKIGTVSPPPGIHIRDAHETVERLSLRRGEVLALCSDGVDAQAALRREGVPVGLPPGELAAQLLDAGGSESGDDATCAVVRLQQLTLST